MSSTYYIFIILILIVAFLLMLVIMVQNPKGGGLSSTFGGGGNQQIGGVQKTTDFLDKSTWALGTILIALILITVVLPFQHKKMPACLTQAGFFISICQYVSIPTMAQFLTIGYP